MVDNEFSGTEGYLKYRTPRHYYVISTAAEPPLTGSAPLLDTDGEHLVIMVQL